MRSGEIFSLTWDKVDLKEGFIDLPLRTPRQAARRIYLNETVREILSSSTKSDTSTIRMSSPTMGTDQEHQDLP